MTSLYPYQLGLAANVIYWDTPWAVPKNHTFLPELLTTLSTNDRKKTAPVSTPASVALALVSHRRSAPSVGLSTRRRWR